MSNWTRLILIWGGLIAGYLILSNSGGFKTAVGATQNFATSFTKTLQGR